MRIATNILMFQAGWFACVLGAAWELPLSGTFVALLLVVLHVTFTPRATREIALIGLAAAIGLVADTLLARLGMITFANGVLLPGWTAYWMLALWIIFAATLNHSLAWLKSRLPLSAALGAIAGPLAYLAGARLGALELGPLAPSLTAIALVWAIAMPTLLAFARATDRNGVVAEHGFA